MSTNVNHLERTPNETGVKLTGVLYGKERLKVPISLVKGINPKVLKISELGKLFDLIKKETGDFYDQSQVVRQLATDNKLEYKKQKETSLNGFLIGEFSKRSKDGISKYVPLLVFDFDGLDTFQYSDILSECVNSPYIFACFPSPSYLGCRLMVWADSTPETHTTIYKSIQKHLSDVFGLPVGGKKGTPQIDKGTSDYSRYWCYTAVGGDFYFNLDSGVFVDKPTIENKTVKDFTPGTWNNEPLTRRGKTDNEPLTDKQKTDLLTAIVKERGKQRNCTVFDLACMLFEHGLNDVQILAYCDTFEEMDFDIKEIHTTVNSASKKALKGIYTDNQLLSYGNKILGYNRVNNIIQRDLSNNQSKVVKTAKKAVVPKVERNETKNETNNNALPSLGEKTPKITQIRNYLNSKYDFRNNTVSNEIEYKTKDQKEYEILNENNLLVELLERGLNGVEKPLIALLKSDFTNKYDPIRDYCKHLPKWTPEDPDYITELANYVKAKDQHWFNYQFKKALVRTLACGLGHIAFNKQCFTLTGGQNAGKSYFIRFLCPQALNKHITQEIDYHNKDGQISLCTNLIINLDDLDKLPHRDIGKLKSFMTLDRVKTRLPYDRTDSYLKRRASFFASTNETEFLSDTTGNVRWLIFPIHTIKHDNGGKNGYSNINIDLVYSQAYYLLNNGFEYLVTKEDLEQSEANNKSHLISSTEQDFIQEYLEPSDKENGYFATTGMIYNKVSELVTVKLNSKKFGEALRLLGFEPVSYRAKEKSYPQKGYFVKSERINFS